MVQAHVGIDPAKKLCVASIVDEGGRTVGKPLSFAPTRSGVAGLVRQVQERIPHCCCHFIVEASGSTWYAPCALLRQLGQQVSLINPQYTASQRRISSPYAKSDAKDADAIARAPRSMGDKAYHPADIPEGPRLNLRLLCRHRHTLQEDATAIKLRVLAWLGLTAPGLAAIVGTDLSAADRQLIARYPVIAKIARIGRARLAKVLQRHGEGEFDETTVEELFTLAKEAYEPRDFDDELMKLQLRMEFARLALLEEQIAQLTKEIQRLYAVCDPAGLAKSLPGFGKVVSAILVAEAGTDMTRFPTVDQFASWTGLVARAGGSAGKQQAGLPMTKAGRSIVKWALYMAANTAMRRDPQLKVFYERLKAKGKHHNAALTAVAHKLARRYWAVMREQRPYETREPDAGEEGAEDRAGSGDADG